MDARDRHAMADYFDPVAVAERRTSDLIRRALAEPPPPSRRHQFVGRPYEKCDVCGKWEVRCRAEYWRGED